MVGEKVSVSASELREMLGVEDDDQLAVLTMTMFAHLTVCMHYLRGMFHLLNFYNKAFQENEQMKHSYNGLRGLLEGLEESMWKHVPPRAMIAELAKWLDSGELSSDVEALLSYDRLGRKLGPGNQEGVDDSGIDTFRAGGGVK